MPIFGKIKFALTNIVTIKFLDPSNLPIILGRLPSPQLGELRAVPDLRSTSGYKLNILGNTTAARRIRVCPEGVTGLGCRVMSTPREPVQWWGCGRHRTEGDSFP